MTKEQIRKRSIISLAIIIPVIAIVIAILCVIILPRITNEGFLDTIFHKRR